MADELNGELVMHQLNELNESKKEHAKVLHTLNDTLTSIRIELSSHHADAKANREVVERCVKTLDGINNRVNNIEHALPMLRMTSNWVRVGVSSLLGLFGLAVWYMVLGHPGAHP